MRITPLKIGRNTVAVAIQVTLSLLATQAASSENLKVAMPDWYHRKMASYAGSQSFVVREALLKQALDSARKFNQADGYPQSDVIFTLAMLYFQQGSFASAEECLREAVRLKQGGLSISMIGKQNISAEAGVILPAYSTITDERNGRLHALANSQSWLGRTLLKEKKYEEAAAILAQSIKLLDDNSGEDKEVILLPDTLLPYAEALRALKRPAEAARAESRAIELMRMRKQLLD